MYQVITMYGENEPWWFFEGWEEDTVEKREFAAFDQGKAYFDQLTQQYTETYEKHRSKELFLTAFWNEGETTYCEDCDEDLQAYKGIMLLKNNEKITDGDHENETINHCGKTQCRTGHS